MAGTLYGVGTGPGDKRLLTLLAVDTLKCAEVIAVPNSGSDAAALRIVEDYIVGKEILTCDMPMTRDESVLTESHQRAANLICEVLGQGKDVAFITLGDPCVYSTYMYVHRLVEQRGFRVQIINGIPSFCAVASTLGISLCDKGELLHIIPASYGNTQELLDLPGNKVLMKSGRQLGDVLDELKNRGLLSKAQMVERCGMTDEKIYRTLEDVDASSYFSVIVVREDVK